MTPKLPRYESKSRTELLHRLCRHQPGLGQRLVAVLANGAGATPRRRMVVTVDDASQPRAAKCRDQRPYLLRETPCELDLERARLIPNVSDLRRAVVGGRLQREQVGADLDAIRVVQSRTSAPRFDLEGDEAIAEAGAGAEEIVGFTT